MNNAIADSSESAVDAATAATQSARQTNRRVPTNLVFENETEFVNVVTQLAAADGAELSAAAPSAKVNLDPPGVDETIRCAVALPVVSEGGPHVSIRKQSPDTLTPVDLLERNALSAELVALLWLCYEHERVVLFSGPTGVGKTSAVHALASDMGWETVELNASDDRGIEVARHRSLEAL
jgi:type IV secretory pathway ATPase VirB11/archaellum biosynthesis ATPase